MSAVAAGARRSVAEAALDHPRHLVLGVAVAGLLLGGRAAAGLVALAALALAAVAVGAPLVRGAPAAVGLAVVLVALAVGAQARTAALDRTAFGPELGRVVAGDVTLLTAPRDDGFGGRRALARWRGEPVLLRLTARDAKVRIGVGDVAGVRGRLLAPDLAARAVHAHATLRAAEVVATGRRRGGAAGIVDGVRRHAEAVLDRGLPTPEAALLRGMVLGEDDALPDDLRSAFRAAGLTHLVAASGQNIMLLAALALGLATVAGVGVRLRWLLVLGLIALYVPLAGAGPSIQRAGIMGAATIAATLAGRPASRWYALLLAAALTLAIDPRAAGDAGWQLSFAAVLGIAMLAPAARERLRRAGLPPAVAEIVGVTLAATLATAPLIAGRFDRFSLVALPANVLAAPAVAPVMWLGMVAAALGQALPALAAPAVALAGLPLGYLAWLGGTAAGLPGAQAEMPAVGVALLSALAAAAIVLRGRRRRRWLAPAAAVVTVLLGLLVVPGTLRGPGGLAPPPAGVLRVTALDIGQGDATLLQVAGHAVLVDAGPSGDGVVGKVRAAGVRRLDALVVTHPQADHDGGAPAVLAGLPVSLLLDGRGGDRAATSRALDAPLGRRDTRVVAAHAGEEVRAGALSLRVLWPPAPDRAPAFSSGAPGSRAGGDPNDRAVVAVASAYGARALLTADAESPVLAPLDLGPVDVLKVSHHGSADDGLPALLSRLRPRVALIEVGRHNTYGHPAPPTLAALAAAVPVVRRTDRDGAVRVDIGGGRLTVSAAGGRGGTGA